MTLVAPRRAGRKLPLREGMGATRPAEAEHHRQHGRRGEQATGDQPRRRGWPLSPSYLVAIHGGPLIHRAARRQMSALKTLRNFCDSPTEAVATSSLAPPPRVTATW